MALAASVVLGRADRRGDGRSWSGSGSARWERSDARASATSPSASTTPRAGRRRRRPRPARPARCSRCSARPAPASPRCCGRSPASSGSAAGSVALGRARPGRRADPPARLRADVPGRPAVPAPERRRQRRLPAAAAPDAAARPWPGGSRSCSSWSDCPASATGARPGCPAASGNGSRWPAALAVEPRLLLLDEPLSALDRGLRERLAHDLRDILVAAGTTALLVTHDQEEAFAVADRMALMRAGRRGADRHRRRGLARTRSTPRRPGSSATPPCSTARPPAGCSPPAARSTRPGSVALRRSALRAGLRRPAARAGALGPGHPRGGPADRRRRGRRRGPRRGRPGPPGRRAPGVGHDVRLVVDLTRTARLRRVWPGGAGGP